MPDHPFPDSLEDAQHRPERRALVCFAADAATEEALRTGLAEAARQEAEFRRADIHKAIAALREMPTPWTLVVDVAGHPQPLAVLEDLSQVVEPDVRVLVVGDREDVGFYRQITRGLGAADYLYKPLTPAMVAEHFGPVVARRRFVAPPARGGRLLTVTGVRGGVGASTIAANLGWYLAAVAQRHTAVLDADLHRGVQALLLGAQAGPGLRHAVEHPDRVDELFVERATVTAGERLHLLAAEEALAAPLAYAPGAAERLVAMLRRRCNFIVADTPYEAAGFGRDLLDLAQHRILVLEPTLACLRDALRLLQLEPGAGQAHRPLLVLNRAGRKGGLSATRVAEALKQEPDIILPDLPKRLEEAATLGQPAAAAGGPFRDAIARLARAAGGVGAEAAPRRGLLGRFRR
ncbi:AAA family ATPase [Paracraurococcus lichenis]|uniref:Cellulose synthase operon protein YhjQ/BcsQ n=1 Tax=Paracraurococcus lichenis TaxID=3064888 RepID=A0ABT9DZ02_9PROT|nr:cellulose synthase operon protein YhjQ/BcsQ [Paracraurococcus sp. LOR1-02]MDO9709136.1 cellulose synthase operon protein YhjQ/BcsQ [Paracraurococcus sp. LOR1-02]